MMRSQRAQKGLIDLYLDSWRNLFNIKNKIRRKFYWKSILSTFICFLVLFYLILIFAFFSSTISQLIPLLVFLFWIPLTSLSCRRLIDADKSPVSIILLFGTPFLHHLLGFDYQLSLIIGIIGKIHLLTLLCSPSK